LDGASDGLNSQAKVDNGNLLLTVQSQEKRIEGLPANPFFVMNSISVLFYICWLLLLLIADLTAIVLEMRDLIKLLVPANKSGKFN
jgi:hypothetical protein